jgi:hypothetical protein
LFFARTNQRTAAPAFAVFEGWALGPMGAGGFEIRKINGRSEDQRVKMAAASCPPCEHRAEWGSLCLCVGSCGPVLLACWDGRMRPSLRGHRDPLGKRKVPLLRRRVRSGSGRNDNGEKTEVKIPSGSYLETPALCKKRKGWATTHPPR